MLDFAYKMHLYFDDKSMVYVDMVLGTLCIIGCITSMCMFIENKNNK